MVITKAGSSIANEWISIHTTGFEPLWYGAQSDNNGDFTVKLPDGEYKFDGVWVSQEQTWYPKFETFSVKDGVLVGSLDLFINLLMN